MVKTKITVELTVEDLCYEFAVDHVLKILSTHSKVSEMNEIDAKELKDGKWKTPK